MNSKIPGAYYQVFLSFRGPDTHHGFTDCLYHFLMDAGISVFRDNEEIRPGMKIQVILGAIESSTVCIPIFSRHYAQSKWCLLELAQMVKLQKTIMPVFYDVTPDDVKLKTDAYRADLSEFRKNGEKESEQWERALQDVLELEISGQNLKEVAKTKGWQLCEYEGFGELCKAIVKEVLITLKLKQKVLTSNLIGMDDQIVTARTCFGHLAGGVRYVGIYGMGGSGKTTLAKMIFNEFCASFDASCFLSDVRASSKAHGLEHLLEKLLSDLQCKLLRERIGDNDDGIRTIRGIYGMRRVLIVLDDVDQREQIKNLAGSSSWFASGSRIIITTRDIQVLGINEHDHHQKLDRHATQVNKSGCVWAMEVGAMKDEQALQLLSNHAFGTSLLPADYLDLTMKAVSTAGGLPLALEIMGSHLRGRSVEEWDDKIRTLAKIPRGDIQKQLMVSYEGLDYQTKQMFLDIACSTVPMDRINAMYMWRSCDFNPDVRIEVLISVLLVKVDEKGTLWMHDHLKDLGREIVCMENFIDYADRRRLWIHDEAVDVLRRGELSEDFGLDWTVIGPESFQNLRNLRMLRLSGFIFEGDFEGQLSKLRWLSWHAPPIFEGADLNLEKLVILDLSGSDIEDDWKGWSEIKMGESLEVVDLSFTRLNRTPDLRWCNNLKRLILAGCTRLTNIDSILNLECLEYLNISWTGIQLPNSIGKLKRLEEVIAYHLYDVEDPKIPTSIGMLSCLRILDLSQNEIRRLPSTINQLSSLQTLNLEECDCLQVLPELPSCLSKLVYSSESLARVPSISSLSNLVTLKLTNVTCSCERQIRLTPPNLDWRRAEFPRLEELDLYLEGVTTFYLEYDAFPQLKTLRLGWPDLEFVPLLPSSLSRLEILLSSGRNLPCLSNLKSLSALTFSQMEESGDGFDSSENLGIEELGELKEVRLTYSLNAFNDLQLRRSLTKLEIDSCPFMKKVPDLSHLKDLKILRIDACRNLLEIPGLQAAAAHSLEELRIRDCKSLKILDSSKFEKIKNLMLAEHCDYYTTDDDNNDVDDSFRLPGRLKGEWFRKMQSD